MIAMICIWSLPFQRYGMREPKEPNSKDGTSLLRAKLCSSDEYFGIGPTNRYYFGSIHPLTVSNHLVMVSRRIVQRRRLYGTEDAAGATHSKCRSPRLLSLLECQNRRVTRPTKVSDGMTPIVEMTSPYYMHISSGPVKQDVIKLS